MEAATLKCRVCGKEYEACRNTKRVPGVFRWQDVACSPEHGATYLDLIRQSRAKQNDVVVNDPVDQSKSIVGREHLDDAADKMLEGGTNNGSKTPKASRLKGKQSMKTS